MKIIIQPNLSDWTTVEYDTSYGIGSRSRVDMDRSIQILGMFSDQTKASLTAQFHDYDTKEILNVKIFITTREYFISKNCMSYKENFEIPFDGNRKKYRVFSIKKWNDILQLEIDGEKIKSVDLRSGSISNRCRAAILEPFEKLTFPGMQDVLPIKYRTDPKGLWLSPNHKI